MDRNAPRWKLEYSIQMNNLSKLVKMCGDRFNGLHRITYKGTTRLDRWFAGGNDEDGELGNTPEEAVNNFLKKINGNI